MLVIKAMMRSGRVKTTTTKTIEFVPEHNELILSDNGCSCQSCSDRSIMLSNEDIYLPVAQGDAAQAPMNPNVAGLIYVMNEQGQTVDKIYPTHSATNVRSVPHALISCKYTEFDVESYSGFSVERDLKGKTGDIKLFSSADPMRDYADARLYASACEIVSEASSVHNFFSDMAKAVADQS